MFFKLKRILYKKVKIEKNPLRRKRKSFILKE